VNNLSEFYLFRFYFFRFNRNFTIRFAKHSSTNIVRHNSVLKHNNYGYKVFKQVLHYLSESS